MKKSSSFLTGFLAMLVAAGLLSSAGTAQAALISINIGPSGFNIGGINGGAASDGFKLAPNFPISGNQLIIYNATMGSIWGLQGSNGLLLGVQSSMPQNFSQGAEIGSGSTYSANISFNAFRNGDSNNSPDWASGSYMGFKTSQGNYGWLEVTWTLSSRQFEIFSGAYESTPNVAILAGASPAVVPEPGTWAAAALLASGAAFMRWRKRAKVA